MGDKSALRRREALTRMAKLALVPLAPLALSSAGCVTYDNYGVYCNSCCQNTYRTGNSYCNYSDYRDFCC